jgi:transposase InsO family protein
VQVEPAGWIVVHDRSRVLADRGRPARRRTRRHRRPRRLRPAHPAPRALGHRRGEGHQANVRAYTSEHGIDLTKLDRLVYGISDEGGFHPLFIVGT